MAYALLSQEAGVVANLSQVGPHLQFHLWPWFDRVRVQFNDNEPLPEQRKTTITIPESAERVAITALGKKGRFATLKYTILPSSDPTTAPRDDAPMMQADEMPAPLIPLELDGHAVGVDSDLDTGESYE